MLACDRGLTECDAQRIHLCVEADLRGLQVLLPQSAFGISSRGCALLTGSAKAISRNLLAIVIVANIGSLHALRMFSKHCVDSIDLLNFDTESFTKFIFDIIRRVE